MKRWLHGQESMRTPDYPGPKYQHTIDEAAHIPYFQSAQRFRLLHLYQWAGYSGRLSDKQDFEWKLWLVARMVSAPSLVAPVELGMPSWSCCYQPLLFGHSPVERPCSGGYSSQAELLLDSRENTQRRALGSHAESPPWHCSPRVPVPAPAVDSAGSAGPADSADHSKASNYTRLESCSSLSQSSLAWR